MENLRVAKVLMISGPTPAGNLVIEVLRPDKQIETLFFDKDTVGALFAHVLEVSFKSSKGVK